MIRQIRRMHWEPPHKIVQVVRARAKKPSWQNNRKRWNGDGRPQSNDRHLSSDERLSNEMEEVKRAIKKIVDKTALEGILYEKVDNATTDWRVECIASAVGYLTKATFELRVFALISAPELVIAGRRYGIDVDQPVHLLISELATAILRTGYVPLSEVDDDTDTFIPLDASIN